MNLSKHKVVHDPWEEKGGQTLLSPPIDKHWEQVVLFDDRQGNDYAIEIELTFLQGEVLNNVLYKEAGVVLRYSAEGRYYYAGLGGFGARIFIGMVEQQNGKSIWSCIASQGKKEQIDFKKPYRLRVECQGAKITLYEDDKNRLVIEDDTYQSGYWGLRTVRTQARFSNIKESGPSTLKVFVIMPFTPSLNFVYETIKNLVIQEGLDCHRVDESAIAQPIIKDIRQRITNADLVIADVTGRNPNVYYEAGFAHALGKKLILIAQSKDDLAFDLAHIRAFFYTNPKELREKLAHAIRDTSRS